MKWTPCPRLSAIPLFMRVACSLFCGAFCLVVVFFWVRSYFYADSGLLKISPSEYIQVHAGDGRMCIWFEHKPVGKWFEWRSSPITVHTPPDAENRIPWFDLAFWPTFARLYAAHWLLAVVAGLLATAPWFPRRFSLKAMLVAVTVVAAITAVIVWVDSTF